VHFIVRDAVAYRYRSLLLLLLLMRRCSRCAAPQPLRVTDGNHCSKLHPPLNWHVAGI